MARKTLTIIRSTCYRYQGISEAAHALGVSCQAVSNFVSRRAPGSLRKAYRDRIIVIDSKTRKEVKE